MPCRCAARPERRGSKRLLALVLQLIALDGVAGATGGEARPPCAAVMEKRGETLEDTLARWLKREGACGADAEFLYRLGQLLNTAHRYQEALDRIEGALLRKPDDWRMQIEFAIALAGSGDELAARSQLEALRARPDVDAVARREIETLLDRRWLQALKPRVTLGLAAGYDDNLLGNAQPGPFELTLPYGRLQVEPGAEQRPAAGPFVRADVRLEGAIPNGNDERYLRYGLFLNMRETPGHAAKRSHWGVVLEKGGDAGPYLQGAYQQLAVEAREIYRQGQAALGWALGAAPPLPRCRHRAGIDLQVRQYPQLPILDGRYAGLQWQTSCATPSGLLVQIRHGQDAPGDAARPGGLQRQTALKLGGQTELGRGLLLADIEFALQRDAAGYSPLLENGQPRRIHRTIGRLEYRWAANLVMHAAWQPYASLEFLDQRANLPLFSVRNAILSIGANIVW